MARQKKTEGIELEELPELTKCQMAYVMARMEGQNKADSVRAAYDTKNWSDNAVYVQSAKLEAHPKVGLWMQSLLREGRIKAECTLDGHLAELARLKEIAIASGNVGAAVQAEKIRGEVAGHKTERVLVQDDRTIADMLQQIEQALGPTIAASIGRQLGVDTASKH